VVGQSRRESYRPGNEIRSPPVPPQHPGPGWSLVGCALAGQGGCARQCPRWAGRTGNLQSHTCG
jgi:hypothetical protein